MDIKTEAEKVMWDLIRVMKTQKAAAKALGQSKQLFNYWLNYANKVPHDQLLAMKELLQKKQLQHDSNSLTPIQNHAPNNQSIRTELKLSEQVKRAMEFEKELGQRRGRPTNDNKKSKEISRTCDEFKGRTDTAAAQKFGFKSKDTYLRAKKVVLSNCSELINAMDEKIITIHHAAQLTTLPHEAIKVLLAKGAAAVIDFLKTKKQPAHNANIQIEKLINLNIFQNELLQKAEKDFQLPLISAFIGLIACCDECGGFHWQPTKLKARILPYTSLDFAQLLLALNQSGLIQKDESVGKTYWRIPLIKQFVREVNHATMVA